MGSSDTNKLHIQTVYTSSAQTLSYVTFTTKSSLTSADAGKMEFYVDESKKLSIDDGGIEVTGTASANILDVQGSAGVLGKFKATSAGHSQLQIDSNGGSGNPNLEFANDGTVKWRVRSQTASGDNL